MRVKELGGVVVLVAALVAAGPIGCSGSLVQLAKAGEWSEVDARARAMKHPPRGKAARAWARALVELDGLEEARAVLLRDFRTGGRTESLRMLADLERERGLLGMAAAHYGRLVTIDLDSVSGDAEVCDLLRSRSHALARLGEAVAADTEMRRLGLLCPADLTPADREFLTELRPAAEAQARDQRALDSAQPATNDVEAQLEVARTRSPLALARTAEELGASLTPDDVAVLLATELGGGLGPGLASPRQLSSWIGDGDPDALIAAVDQLPDGAREYALLRIAAVRELGLDGTPQGWIVGAMAALDGQGPHEAAKAWRVAAAMGDLTGAEFALNTNLRDMIPTAEPVDGAAQPSPAAGLGSLGGVGGSDWAMKVPVERRSFDLLLTLARLFELRDRAHEALELRRAVIAAGYEAGLAQVAGAAVEEVRRQLVLGHPWQALAIAEGVPGPLVDEVLPTVASSLGLLEAAGVDVEAEDRRVVRRSMGDAWIDDWQARVDNAAAGLRLRETGPCPDLARWIDDAPEAAEHLRSVGLDPARSRRALELGITGAEGGADAIAEAVESDLALACSAVLLPLLQTGVDDLLLAKIDDRLVHAPDLASVTRAQLHAEVALGHGQVERALQLSIAAGATSADPASLWRRAAVAGSATGAREYTLHALREVLAHSPGGDEAARRELVLTRLRDVDRDPILREAGGEAEAQAQAAGVAEMRAVVRAFVEQAAAPLRWGRMDGLLWTLADEPRVDEQAWRLLTTVLLDDATRRTHPEASAAIARAAADATGTGASPVMGGGGPSPALVDADALCERPLPAASDDAGRRALIGAAATCGRRDRARALAALVAGSGPERAEITARVLAGPVAAVPRSGQPGALQTTPAITGERLRLRVVAGLPLEPEWVVDDRG